MLYVFTGSDQVVVREKAFACVHAQIEKGLSEQTLLPEQYQVGALASLSSSVSLFSGKEVIVLDLLSDAEGAFEEVVACAEMLAESENVFVVIENKITAGGAKELKAHAKEFFESKETSKDFFNVFSLADALMRRDKKMLWVLLLRARSVGLTPEELIGTLFWQLKSLRLARVTKSAEEAGLKEFVYSKAKRGLSNFKEGELEMLSRNLVTLYHEGHLGKDINLSLERWVLKI